MKTVGIISEYNPFHNGHQWQIQQARKLSGCTHVICVMSGNFVQRGELAIFDKWKRAEMAILGGADVVLELPVVFSVRSAQYFATGGIRLLHSLGIVSHLCFGAETPDLSTLWTYAKAIDNKETLEAFRRYLKDGLTYAAALSQAIQTTYNHPIEKLNHPNNILAVEYLRAIRKYAPSIIPIAVERHHAHYHDTNIAGTFASATAIRQALFKEELQTVAQVLPNSSYQIINELFKNKRGPADIAKLENVILAKLRTTSLTQLEQLPDISEGLHYKLQQAALKSGNIGDLLFNLKSRRYPLTRLQRILIHTLLGTSQSLLNEFDLDGPRYARILAFNTQGREIIKELNQHASVPVVTKTSHYLNSLSRNTNTLTKAQQMLAYDTLASDVYTLSLPVSPWTTGAWDFKQSPCYRP
jgi:predicted nucleotidyltransferase